VSGSVELSFISYQFGNFKISFLRELLLRISVSEDRSGLGVWVEVTGSEGGLVRRVFRVVGWVGRWHRSGSVSSGGAFKSLIVFRDVLLVEPCRRNLLRFAFQVLLVQHLSALFRNSLLEVGVSSQRRDVPLILWNDHVFSFNGLALHIVSSKM